MLVVTAAVAAAAALRVSRRVTSHGVGRAGVLLVV